MKQKKRMTVHQKRKRQNVIRRIIQFVFFLFLSSLFSEAFAGVKGLFGAVGQGKEIAYNDFVQTFLILGIITIIFGRYFCGYVCAFGSLGDFIYGISKWMQKKGNWKIPNMPEQVCYWLQKLKYLNVTVILAACIFGRADQIGRNSPWEVFSRMRAFDFNIKSYRLLGLIFLVIIFAGMFWEERFFCQFLCPLGAIFSLLPILPTGTLNRNQEQCITGCSACRRQCPVHRKPEGISIYSNECIQCGRCSLVCPKGNISLDCKQLKKAVVQKTEQGLESSK